MSEVPLYQVRVQDLVRTNTKCYGWVTRWGTPMLGNVTALKGLHVTGNYRNRSMQMLKAAAWLRFGDAWNEGI